LGVVKVSRLEGLVLENAQAKNLVSEAQVSSARAAHEAALASGEPSNFFAHLAQQLDPSTRASVREIYQTALRDEFGGETVATEPPQPSPSGRDTVPPRSQLATVAEPPSVVGESLPSIPGYRLEDELGRGGMGVVYRAVNEASGERVALKVLLAGAKATSEDLIRFRTEAEAAERLQHPHIVALLEHGEANGNPYMVLDYIEGEDLESRISRGKLEPADAVEIASGLADALSCAHEQGILHRDFKPQNVLLDREGHPLLTDFGLAKLRGDAAPTLSLTQTGMMLGTPAYMAPEQANAERKHIDERTDVYGLGATLYHMLTGRRPFSAPTLASLVVKILNEPPPRPRSLVPDLDPALETIVLKCLEKERSDRYPNARSLQRDLNRWERNLAIVAAPPTLVTRAQRVARRNPAAVGAGAFAVLMLLVALVFGYRSMRAEAELAQLQGVDEETDPGSPTPSESPEEQPSGTREPAPIEQPAEEQPADPQESAPIERPAEASPSPVEQPSEPATHEPAEAPEQEPQDVEPLTPAPEEPVLPPRLPAVKPVPVAPDNKPLQGMEPPAPILRRIRRLESGRPAHGFAPTWEEAREEARALNLPIAVLALGPQARLGNDSSSSYLEVLRERTVLVLAQPPHRFARPVEPCDLYPGLACKDHIGNILSAVVSAGFGENPQESSEGRARRRKPLKAKKGPRDPHFKGLFLFVPLQDHLSPVTLVATGGSHKKADFPLNLGGVGAALDRAQGKIGPSPLLEALRVLSPHLYTVDRLHALDPELGVADVGESARILRGYVEDPSPPGIWSRHALRELCSLSIQRARERGSLEEELPLFWQHFGAEPACSVMLRAAESRIR